MRITKTASLPALPYQSKKFFTGQEKKNGADLDGRGYLPGYTGHQHGAQHVFAMSYGATTKALAGGESDMCERSMKFLHYGEERPLGDVLTEKHRIPGVPELHPGQG